MRLLDREYSNEEIILFFSAIAVCGIVLFLTPVGAGIVDVLNQVTIYAIPSVNAQISVFDKLYEPTKAIDGLTFYLWENTSIEPATILISAAGTATRSVSPNQTISWAAGSYECDGTLYYWEKETAEIEQQDNPLQPRLYAVPECTQVSVKMFDNSYRDLSSNELPTGNTQYNLKLQFDITGEYTALRREHICVDYDTSIVRKVRFGGLKEIASLPTRIISGVDQCWETGMDWYYYDNITKMYDLTVNIITGQSVAGMSMSFYLIDQDKYWKDGKFYFMNPVTFDNMGAGSPAGTAYCSGEYVSKERKTCEANITISWASNGDGNGEEEGGDGYIPEDGIPEDGIPEIDGIPEDICENTMPYCDGYCEEDVWQCLFNQLLQTLNIAPDFPLGPDWCWLRESGTCECGPNYDDMDCLIYCSDIDPIFVSGRKVHSNLDCAPWETYLDGCCCSPGIDDIDDYGTCPDGDSREATNDIECDDCCDLKGWDYGYYAPGPNLPDCWRDGECCCYDSPQDFGGGDCAELAYMNGYPHYTTSISPFEDCFLYADSYCGSAPMGYQDLPDCCMFYCEWDAPQL